jgi:hypothetical protein
MNIRERKRVSLIRNVILGYWIREKLYWHVKSEEGFEILASEANRISSEKPEKFVTAAKYPLKAFSSERPVSLSSKCNASGNSYHAVLMIVTP